MDQELKQRMIGASVIIALAVIFVPMLFDGNIEEKHNKNISINIPEEPSNDLEVKKFAIDKPVTESVNLPAGEVELTLKDSAPILIAKEPTITVENIEPQKPVDNNETTQITDINVDETKQEPSSEQASNENIVKPVDKPIEKPVKKPVATTVEKPLTQKAVEVQKSAEEMSQAFRVKLGSFSQQGNAENVKSKLLQNNIKAIVEYNPGLKLYRVWSQQLYQNESSAVDYVKAVEKLKLNIGTPKVITLKAEDVDQMASQGQLGWVVQLGSFSDKNNAIDLRNKTRAAGFNAFVDMVVNSKGVELYRLRVGPLMEKTDAEKKQAEIKTRLKLDGLVKSHELGQIVN